MDQWDAAAPQARPYPGENPLRRLGSRGKTPERGLMGIFDFFKKQKPQAPDPVKGLTLSALQKGWLVDFDLQTWEVAAVGYYDWGDGETSREWRLESVDQTVFLETWEDDGRLWSVSRKIPLDRIDEEVKQRILDDRDPAEEIHLDGVTYYLDEESAGHYYRQGSSKAVGFIVWDYEDDEGDRLVSIEQWGETELEAYQGDYVEEYAFTNILPKQGP